MASQDSALRALLRPTDTVIVALEAFVVPQPTDPAIGTPVPPLPADVLSDPESVQRASEDARNRRVLAVVSHNDGPNSPEEGSVFVLKARSPGRALEQSDILRVFPVFGDFSVSMAQIRRSTLSLRLSQASSTLISLTITQGDILGRVPLVLCTQQVETLRTVLAECKRLKELVDAPPLASAPPLTTFSWLAPYTARRAPLPSLFALPEDLRVAYTPLHLRLSAAFAGDPGDDASDIVRIRDDWIRTRVREEGSRGKHLLRIRVGSFNVNGSLPSQDLSLWLGTEAAPSIPDQSLVSILNRVEKNPFEAASPLSSVEKTAQMKVVDAEVVSSTDTEGEDDDSGPDLLVLGFQELDLSAEALIYASSTAREDAWCDAVFAALGSRAGRYEKLVSKQLVGILVVAIVRTTMRPCFGEIKSSAAGTGIMGLMGNKGGTALRMHFTPPATDAVKAPAATVLTFVNAHLAAFDEMVERRHADFHELTRRLQFDLGAAAAVPRDGLPSADLNYRVDALDEDVRTILDSEDWAERRFETLLQYDQLKAAVRDKKAFTIFNEGPITHFPTYRFNPGLLKDPLGYDLKRRPAWTDRVLWASNAFARVEQRSYTGHPQITMSDHRPVSAEFTVEINIVDRPAAEAAADKLYRQLKGLEDAHEDTNARVNLKIMNVNVDMGKISYKKTVTQQVAVRNIGRVPCAYRLVPVDDESSIHPDWLTVEPMTALLLPDELVQITLTACIGNDSAARLNVDHKELNCTLILHTVMGKDHFIAVTAEYVPTCFANSLTRLTRLPGPIRSEGTLLTEDRTINAPREVMRLINWMMASDISMENIFVATADEMMVDTIRECLDTGAEFPFKPSPTDEKVPVAFGETLLRLLDSLPEPLVPVDLQQQCVEMTSRDEVFEMLDAFPPVAVNVWISVTAFLNFVCQSSADPEIKTTKIGGEVASHIAYL
ncbi:DNase I-like protein [Mycena pura]|uniref:DNase I-like protein n=1 Tax=Mycena pura TaxID=153505 RepID=A0AAD6Y835_9AGAR|nr:DNase I-like protein [Mycena pura]